MPDESGFVIDGRTYPVPTLDTFTMDEAQVLYDYAGLALEDFGPAHPSWPKEEQDAHEAGVLHKAKNPAFKRALVHVAYARGNPTESLATVRAIAGNVNILEATLALFGGDDDNPPVTTDSQNEPESENGSSQTSRQSDSGSPSSNDSDGLVSLPVRTGITESPTSSQAFIPTG